MALSYITKQGDTFDIIAKQQMGDEHYLHLLVSANFPYRKVTVFSSGIKLTIPNVPQNAQVNNALIAPWKRSSL